MNNSQESLYPRSILKIASKLSERESARLNLLANGFTMNEIAARQGMALSSVKNSFESLYHRLAVRDGLQASLFWVRLGDFRLDGLQDTVGLERFKDLESNDKDLLDALVSQKGLNNEEIAEKMGKSYGYVKGHLIDTADLVRVRDEEVNRNVLAVGFELSKDPSILNPQAAEDKYLEDVQRRYLVLTAKERQILFRVSAGLTNEQISNKLNEPIAAVGNSIHRLRRMFSATSRLELIGFVNYMGLGVDRVEPAPLPPWIGAAHI